MAELSDLKDFFSKQDCKFIIAADAETLVHRREGKNIVGKTSAGGVSVALDPVARAGHAVYIARAKTLEDREVSGKNNRLILNEEDNRYILKRIFVTDEELEGYYNGFSNQTLWPMCHVAFEKPEFRKDWFESYKRVNYKFAQSIKEEIRGKTFIWVNDYQLAMVPYYLDRPRNTIIGMFWHIPWPTWEVFRTLPYKKEILESLLKCDFLAFHRGYQARNFIKTVEREFEARIDEETKRIFYGKSSTTVTNLPMGIDTDVIRSLITEEQQDTLIQRIVKNLLDIKNEEVSKQSSTLDAFFKNNKVIIGIDRLDYIKGLRLRLLAIDEFLAKNPKYIGKIVYLGILSPSREKIPAYINLKKDIDALTDLINKKYSNNLKNWKPINLIHQNFSRNDIINFYKKADLCLVTPIDDGMNLVSKEFVIAASLSDNPGMLVLSQFAGSSIDLSSSLIVNPYDIDAVAEAIKTGLEMPIKEKRDRLSGMVDALEDKNVYDWARDFVRGAQLAARDNRGK